MKRASPIAARAVVHLLLWTALLALMVGSHQSLRFCIGSCCQAMTVVEQGSGDESCSCCKPKTRKVEGDGALRADVHCQSGCCIDVNFDFEHGPVPRRVVLDDGQGPTVALLPELPPSAVVLNGWECDPCAPATGPPRRDRRTLLLSSTILRL